MTESRTVPKKVYYLEAPRLTINDCLCYGYLMQTKTLVTIAVTKRSYRVDSVIVAKGDMLSLYGPLVEFRESGDRINVYVHDCHVAHITTVIDV